MGAVVVEGGGGVEGAIGTTKSDWELLREWRGILLRRRLGTTEVLATRRCREAPVGNPEELPTRRYCESSDEEAARIRAWSMRSGW
jgi:hypothetical protein